MQVEQNKKFSFMPKRIGLWMGKHDWNRVQLLATS